MASLFFELLVFACNCTFFLTHFCGSFCPSLFLLSSSFLLPVSFPPHFPLARARLFIVFFSIHRLHSFSFLFASLSVTLLIFPSYQRILFSFSICLSSTAFYYFSLFSPLLSIALLYIFIPLSQHHMCHGGKHREQRSLLNNYHAKQSK